MNTSDMRCIIVLAFGVALSGCCHPAPRAGSNPPTMRGGSRRATPGAEEIGKTLHDMFALQWLPERGQDVNAGRIQLLIDGGLWHVSARSMDRIAIEDLKSRTVIFEMEGRFSPADDLPPRVVARPIQGYRLIDIATSETAFQFTAWRKDPATRQDVVVWQGQLCPRWFSVVNDSPASN